MADEALVQPTEQVKRMWRENGCTVDEVMRWIQEVREEGQLARDEEQRRKQRLSEMPFHFSEMPLFGQYLIERADKILRGEVMPVQKS